MGTNGFPVFGVSVAGTVVKLGQAQTGDDLRTQRDRVPSGARRRVASYLAGARRANLVATSTPPASPARRGPRRWSRPEQVPGSCAGLGEEMELVLLRVTKPDGARAPTLAAIHPYGGGWRSPGSSPQIRWTYCPHPNMLQICSRQAGSLRLANADSLLRCIMHASAPSRFYACKVTTKTTTHLHENHRLTPHLPPYHDILEPE